MDLLEDYSDSRHKSWCIHCGVSLANAEWNQDHVPTRYLLQDPEAEDLPTVTVCKPCNEGFSASEQYLVALLNSVLCGSAAASDHPNQVSARILRGDKKLRRDLRNSRCERQSEGGGKRIVWGADLDRLRPAIIKYARRHIYYEWGEFYQLSEQVLAKFKIFQGHDWRDQFPGEPIEQAGLIWRGSPLSLRKAVMQANWP